MKILLIGEYSRLHNSLKEGLTKLNHQVTLIGGPDGFKNYPIDINIRASFFNKPIIFLLTKITHKLTSISLIELENAYRFYKVLPKLKGFDIIQLINEKSLKTYPKLEIWFLKKLISQNQKLYLLSCGTDYMSVKHANDKKFKYSILTPFHNNQNLKKEYKHILKHLKKPHYKLYSFLYKNINGVIASDMDYHIPLIGNKKYLGLIPNPINLDKIEFKPLIIKKKIKIFHGINSTSSIRKGSSIICKALKLIKKKYPDKVTIKITEDLPYDEYINIYNDCHIFIDQVYGYDQGFNALEAMAKGKVVFTGAEQEWLDYYDLKEDTVAINALPDADSIFKKLEWLIFNPDKTIEIGKNARRFIEKEHHYIDITKKYIKKWTE